MSSKKSDSRVINQSTFEIVKKVRQTIKELGGTMPENLPTHDSIQKVKRKSLKGKKKEIKDSK